MIGFNNGIYQEVAEITIPITSISINRGYGAFEFFEVINGKPFYGDRHYARFLRSMEILRIGTSYDDKVEDIVLELIQRNQIKDGYFKLFALPHGQSKADFSSSSLYVFPVNMPLFDDDLYENGAHLQLKKYERFLPEAKSTNYLSGQYWINENTDDRFVDVLFTNGKTIQETSRGNVFAVKDGTVITPKENVLMGVTRGLVLEILDQLQLKHEERELTVEELFNADEVFLSSTTKYILPISKIDECMIGSGKPGEITQTVSRYFQKLRFRYK